MKKGTIYSYLDIIIPAAILFFVFIFMNTMVGFDRSKIDNRIVEAQDTVTAEQDLVNLMRLQSPVDGMTYAQLFMHMQDNEIEDSQEKAINSALKEYFSLRGEWNLRVHMDDKELYNYMMRSGDISDREPIGFMTYKLQLPSQKKLIVELYEIE